METVRYRDIAVNHSTTYTMESRIHKDMIAV